MFMVESQDREHSLFNTLRSPLSAQAQALAVANFLHANIVVSHMKAFKTCNSRKAKEKKTTCQTKCSHVQRRSKTFKYVQGTSKYVKVVHVASKRRGNAKHS